MTVAPMGPRAPDVAKPHVRLAETGMVLCITLAALLAVFVAVTANLNRLIGAGGGLAAEGSVSVISLSLATAVPLVAFYVAFARTAGRMGAPARLTRREVASYMALIVVVMAASFARVLAVGLETTLMIVTLPPVLLFLAICQNRRAQALPGDALS